MKPRDLALEPRALVDGRDAKVRLRWLGTAGFEIEHDGWIVLIDPYLTRASLGRCLWSRIEPDLLAIRRHIRGADAIVCGHTHFDHVLDVPAIARMTGARVYGSSSAVHLCRAAGIPQSQLRDVQSSTGRAETRAEVGPFELAFVPSAHSPLMFGRVPFPGDIADCDQVPTRVHQYRCGAVFGVVVRVAGRSIYHAGSANVCDDVTPSLSEVDLLLMCTAGWTSTRAVVPRMLRAVSPGTIVLSHWDNFFLPMHAAARPLPALELPRFVDALHHEGRGVRVGTMDLLGELWL